MKRTREPDKSNATNVVVGAGGAVKPSILTISDSEDDDKPLGLRLVSKEEMRDANAWTYEIKGKTRKTRQVSFANAYFQSTNVSESRKQAFVKNCSDMIKEQVTKKQFNSRITALFENRIKQEVDATPGLEQILDKVRADHASQNDMPPPKKWADSQNSKTGAAGAADKKKKNFDSKVGASSAMAQVPEDIPNRVSTPVPKRHKIIDHSPQKMKAPKAPTAPVAGSAPKQTKQKLKDLLNVSVVLARTADGHGIKCKLINHTIKKERE